MPIHVEGDWGLTLVLRLQSRDLSPDCSWVTLGRGVVCCNSGCTQPGSLRWIWNYTGNMS